MPTSVFVISDQLLPKFPLCISKVLWLGLHRLFGLTAVNSDIHQKKFWIIYHIETNFKAVLNSEKIDKEVHCYFAQNRESKHLLISNIPTTSGVASDNI